MFVEGVDADRPGFAGLLADVDRHASPAGGASNVHLAEGPGTRAPVAVSEGASDPTHAAAIAAFQTWLEDERGTAS